MKMVKLGDVCEMKSGGTPRRNIAAYYNGNIYWAKISDLDKANDSIVTKTEETITEAGLESINNRLFEKGTLLLAMYGSVGKTAFTGCQMSSNQAILGINAKNCKKLSLKFLSYWLNKEKQNLIKNARGVALQNISASIVKNLEIPLPPLEEQKRIAEILDKADEVRRKRRKAIEQCDEYLRSVFLDMFGDPVTNPKGWEVKKLGELGELNRGISKHRPRNAPELLNGNYPLIQTGDIANSNRYITEYKQTYSELGLKQSKMWPKGTLCITIAANIAKTGILNFDACFPDSVVGFKANSFTNIIYIQAWLGFLQQSIEKKAPESAQKNINLEILRNIYCICPDINIQQKFAEIVKKTEALKAKMEEQLQQAEKMFNSLMQRAFKGEL